MKKLALWLACIAVGSVYLWTIITGEAGGFPLWLRVLSGSLILLALGLWWRAHWTDNED